MVQTREITDGMDLYPSNVDTAGYGFRVSWPPSSTVGFTNTIIAGRSGGQAIRFSGTGGQRATRSFTPTTQIVMGCAYRRLAAIGGQKIFIFYSSSGNEQFALGVSDDMKLEVLRGGTVIASSLIPVMLYNTWHYLELAVTLSDTVGTVEVHLDGVSIPSMTLAGADTKNHTDADIGRIALQHQISQTHDFDDFYLEIGGTAFVGEGRMEVLIPTSDVSAGGFAPSTGATLVGVLDEIPANASDFVSATPAGSEFRVGMGNLSVTPESIYGVQIESLSQKDEAGTRTLRNKLWSGAVEFDGVTQAAQLNSFTFKRDWLKLNPDGATAWVAASVNAIDLGNEIVV